jgi:MoxR-like ATPase
MRAAQANAAVNGFDFVRPDDVKAMASCVLAHRVMARAELRTKGQTTEQIIDRILEAVPAPVPVG